MVAEVQINNGEEFFTKDFFHFLTQKHVKPLQKTLTHCLVISIARKVIINKETGELNASFLNAIKKKKKKNLLVTPCVGAFLAVRLAVWAES